MWRHRTISQDQIIEYIKELDLYFSRLISRFRMLYNKYTGEKITDTQFLVLRSLRNKGPCNTSHLAQTLGVTLSAITALINRLFKQGLVSRERKADDRRQVWLSITPKGLSVLEEVEEKRHQMLAALYSRFPEGEREQLLDLLRKVVHLYELHGKNEGKAR